MSRSRRNRQILGILLTIVAVLAVAWFAIRTSTPTPAQSRVVLTGKRQPTPSAKQTQPLFVGVDTRTGDVTIVSQNERGRVSGIVLPREKLQQPSELLEAPPQKTERGE